MPERCTAFGSSFAALASVVGYALVARLIERFARPRAAVFDTNFANIEADLSTTAPARL